MEENKRKAFEDTGKWMIFKSPLNKKWTVTPPLGTDHERWEKEFTMFKAAATYYAYAVVQAFWEKDE